jgi:hypothetical protein
MSATTEEPLAQARQAVADGDWDHGYELFSHTVHRELTGDDADLEAFVVRVGRGPEEVAAAGPEEWGDESPEVRR